MYLGFQKYQLTLYLHPFGLHDIVNQKRYAYLVIGNLRNFRFDARDSMVVLTHMAWAAIVTSASWAFSGPPIRRGIVGSRFLLIDNNTFEPFGIIYIACSSEYIELQHILREYRPLFLA